MTDEQTNGPDDGGEMPPMPPPPPSGIPKAPPVSDLPPAMTPGYLAPYGTRLAGYLLDAVLLAFVAVPIALLTHVSTRTGTSSALTTTGTGTRHFSFGSGSNVPFVLLDFVYATILIAAWAGHTVGMRLVRVQCVTAADGTKVTWGRSAGRAAVFAVLSILILPGLIDLLWPLWDSKNQTLHDKAAGTVVIKV